MSFEIVKGFEIDLERKTLTLEGTKFSHVFSWQPRSAGFSLELFDSTKGEKLETIHFSVPPWALKFLKAMIE